MIATAIDHLERALLRHMANQAAPFGPTDTFFPIAILTIEPLDRELTRALLRHMKARGLCHYARGLFDDDGNPRGAGYALTDKGLAHARPDPATVRGMHEHYSKRIAFTGAGMGLGPGDLEAVIAAELKTNTDYIFECLRERSV